MELLAPGTVVADRYRLIRKRGSGGVGSVWLAHDRSLDSFCGIKLIDSRQADAAELGVRAEREARSAAQLRGTHVIDVFEHGIWNGIPFIAMEYLDGEDLRERLARNTRLDAEQTYRIIAQVARALVRAHGIGIVHRDLKPDNIFLARGDEHEVAKLLDFGIARHEAYSAQIKTTQTGSLIGTPCYMSPEQAHGATIDWRSDLWALGVVVFECLTGRMPFASDALGELMLLILREPIPSLSQYAGSLPKSIDGWWQRASARDPAERFQSAKQLADALAVALALEQRLEIPDILPLGLRARGVASVPDQVPSPRRAEQVPRAASAGDALGPRRPRPPFERWLTRVGGAALLGVVAISVFSGAHDAKAARRPPALLRHAAAGLGALAQITPEPERAVVTPQPAPKRAVRKPIARPGVQPAPWPKPAPAVPEPANACEREPEPAEEPELPEASDDVPDYGI